MTSHSPSNTTLADALRGRATDAIRAGRFSRAELLLRSADALEMSVASAIDLGERLASWGRESDGEEALVEAWERAKKLECPDKLRRSCLALARHHRSAGDEHLATRFEQRAIASDLRHDDGVIHASTLLASAVGALEQNALDDAKTLSQGAAAADETFASDAASVTAVAELRSGDADAAGEGLYRAYRLHKKSGRSVEAAADLFFLGKTLRVLGRHGDAAVCFVSAAETWELHGELAASQDAATAAHECRRVALAAGQHFEMN